MSLLTVIRTRLLAQGAANGNTWPCYIGYAPDDQDQVISLLDTGGFPVDTLGSENCSRTFQLRVRAAQLEYSACEARWRLCFDALHAADLSASGIYLLDALASGPLPYLDEKNRWNMTVNFRAVTTRTV